MVKRRGQAARGDAEATLPVAETVVELSQDYGLTLYLAWGKAYRGWTRALLRDREAGAKELREGLASLADQGSKVHLPLYQPLLAEIEAELGESALNGIDGAVTLARETGEHWSDSFPHRVRGDICSSWTRESPRYIECGRAGGRSGLYYTNVNCYLTPGELAWPSRATMRGWGVFLFLQESLTIKFAPRTPRD
jgi:hypothetical protein